MLHSWQVKDAYTFMTKVAQPRFKTGKLSILKATDLSNYVYIAATYPDGKVSAYCSIANNGDIYRAVKSGDHIKTRTSTEGGSRGNIYSITHGAEALDDNGEIYTLSRKGNGERLSKSTRKVFIVKQPWKGVIDEKKIS